VAGTTANPDCNGQHGSNSEHEINTSERGEYALGNTEQMGGHDTDTNGIGLRRKGNGVGESRFFSQTNTPNDWQNFPTQSPICSGDDGISTRLDSITFPKWRNESIKAAGNAIVPQVAFQIFKTIKLYNEKL
jgi:DNA (cytosine-5)-methyltransferase 1